MIARPEWQENSDRPCDTGSSVTALAKEFDNVDFSTVDPTYPSKTGPFAYSKEAVMQRGIDARRWLSRRPEKVIAVISHGAFLRTSVAKAWFMNADYRVFDFVEGDPDSSLVEWAWTSTRGGARGKSFQDRPVIKEGDFEDQAKTPEADPNASRDNNVKPPE